MAERTKKTRARFTRDSKWLRRARAHFCLLARSWVEEARNPIDFRERLSRVGMAMYKHGLLAGTPQHSGRFTVLSIWRKFDGKNWWTWRNSDVRIRVACMWRGEFQEYVAKKNRKHMNPVGSTRKKMG